MNKHRTNNNFDTQEFTHKIKQYYSINEKLTFNHQQHLFLILLLVHEKASILNALAQI
jgi:hypothetical protein